MIQHIALPSGGTLTYIPRSSWDTSSLPRLGHMVPSHWFKGLVVHHTVTNWKPEEGREIDQAIDHMSMLQTVRPDLGKDVPYSSVVFRTTDPKSVIVAEGRGWARTGAHTDGYNSSRWGVAIAGNTNVDPVTVGVVDGINFVGQKLVGSAEPTFGHRDVKATACQGDKAYAKMPSYQPPFRYSVPTGDTVHQLTDSEKLDEVNAILRLVHSPEELVTLCYTQILDRQPDPEGFTYWVTHLENGYPVHKMIQSFYDSKENTDG